MAIRYKSAATPRTLAQLVSKANKKSLSRRGFNEGKIITAWPEIVGRELAGYAVPERIAYSRSGEHGATLHIACDSSWAMEIQYHSPLILEQIARYFGYRAVEKIAIRQTHMDLIPPSPTPEKPKDPVALNPLLSAPLEQINDAEIKAALEKLALRLSTR